MRHRALVLLVVVLGLVAACSGDDPDPAADAGEDVADGAADPAEDVSDEGQDASDAAEDAADAAQSMADDLAEDLEERQAAEGGGGATVTIDDETWEFDAVLCAMGPDEIGQEGAELVVSATADGLQFYVSIDSFGNSISLNDIEDFQNPSVAWSTLGTSAEEVVIDVDGNEVSGSSDTFVSEITGAEASGSFEATCP